MKMDFSTFFFPFFKPNKLDLNYEGFKKFVSVNLKEINLKKCIYWLTTMSAIVTFMI